MQSNITASLFIALLIFGVISAAPSHEKTHKKCSDKLYLAMKSLCSYRGYSEFLRNSATKCCQDNCEISEMMALCVVAPNFDDDLLH
ncbi:INSulin related [Caenorhabditis elegans]|uniref:INSulin related n=1 Tax=Caenorhabditis elegans TaxID=6239 RepID=Q7JP47_CAEEL|nr:INSulin related [Caenorhabditis elegans]CCD64850.1 INSulin related [Caenorhabditis elegans]|eukprot:NP_001021963.1 INSulin related [Caenorhabditis elegans]